MALRQDTLMIYATGGIAYANASFTATDANTTNQTETVDFDDIGYVSRCWYRENNFYRGLRLRVEGLYYSFDDKINTGDGFCEPMVTLGDFVEFRRYLVNTCRRECSIITNQTTQSGLL